VSAKNKGYSFITFDDLFSGKAKEPFIILRHDVDQHIEPVEQMHTIEEYYGAISTYFLRVHGRYNLGFKPNLEIVSALPNIGLHADSWFKNTDGDAGVLGGVLKRKIKYYATHDLTREASPAAKAVRCVDYDKLKEFNLKYISDSSHSWREGCMCKWVEKGEPRLYVLVHPMWWFVETSQENY
jgi:hypothetical protein